MTTTLVRLCALVASLAVLTGCSGDPGPTGSSCSVTDNGDGTATISCTDGTKSIVGKSGKTSLVRLDAEPPGKNCTNGGTAVKSGLDLNNDGKLDDAEVTSTSYVCTTPTDVGPVIEGDYVIKNSLDATLIQGVVKITGNLTIMPFTTAQLALPNLVEVGGILEVNNVNTNSALGKLLLPKLAKAPRVLMGPLTGVTEVDLSALTGTTGEFYLVADGALKTVRLDSFVSGGDVQLGGTGLTAVPFTNLKSVVDLGIGNTPIVDLAGLSKLTTVTGKLAIGGNLDLTSLNGLQGVKSAGDVEVTNNSTLTTLAGLDGLAATTGSVHIQGNALTSASLPALTTVAGTLSVEYSPLVVSTSFPKLLSVGALELINDTSLTSVSLPLLKSGSLRLASSSLTSLTLPQLATGSVEVTNDATLTTLSAPVLVSGDVSVTNLATLTSLSAPLLATAVKVSLLNVPALTMVSLPALASVSGELQVAQAPLLQTLAFPALTSAQGAAINVYTDAALSSLGMPVLTTAGSIEIWDDASLVTIAMQSLSTTSGKLHVVNDNALTSLVLTNLASVGGELWVANDYLLTTVAAPSLTSIAQGLTLSTLTNLTTLNFPALTTVGVHYEVYANQSLKQCTAAALLAQLTPKPPSVFMSGNQGVGTCP